MTTDEMFDRWTALGGEVSGGEFIHPIPATQSGWSELSEMRTAYPGLEEFECDLERGWLRKEIYLQ